MIDLEQRIAELINDSMRTTPYAEASLGWKMTCVNTAKAIIGGTMIDKENPNLPGRVIQIAKGEAMIDRTYELEDALRRVKQWCDAYPKTVFMPVSDFDMARAQELLGEAGISMSAMHAQWARHILQGIGEIVDSVLSHKGN